jgi:hypothetical protein
VSTSVVIMATPPYKSDLIAGVLAGSSQQGPSARQIME